MELFEAIMTRRSIRKYTNKPVSDETIKQLLEAAMAAPSAKNTQPWCFIVIKDRKMLDTIPTFHPYSKMVLEAPVAIFVCADEHLQSNAGYWAQDCGAAVQNLLLAAHGLGLGAVWLGVHPREERVNGMKELCQLPDHIKPFALIALGYPNETKDQVNRYTEDKISINKWDK